MRFPEFRPRIAAIGSTRRSRRLSPRCDAQGGGRHRSGPDPRRCVAAPGPDDGAQIQSLKSSITSVPVGERPGWRARAVALEARLQEASRSALLKGAAPGGGGADARAVRSAESSIIKAASGVRKLEDSRRVLAETEDIASTVLQQLHQQSKDMERMRQRVHDMNEDLTVSQRVLRRMRRWWS